MYKRVARGNNLETNDGNLAILKSLSLRFQLSNASSEKLVFSPLVMRSTMEESRRRLEGAGDSLAPANETDQALSEWTGFSCCVLSVCEL